MAMLANVHLAGNDDNDDDLYSGFGTEEVAPELQTEDLEFDEGFQVRFRFCTIALFDYKIFCVVLSYKMSKMTFPVQIHIV